MCEIIIRSSKLAAGVILGNPPGHRNHHDVIAAPATAGAAYAAPPIANHGNHTLYWSLPNIKCKRWHPRKQLSCVSVISQSAAFTPLMTQNQQMVLFQGNIHLASRISTYVHIRIIYFVLTARGPLIWKTAPRVMSSNPYPKDYTRQHQFIVPCLQPISL